MTIDYGLCRGSVGETCLSFLCRACLLSQASNCRSLLCLVPGRQRAFWFPITFPLGQAMSTSKGSAKPTLAAGSQQVSVMWSLHGLYFPVFLLTPYPEAHGLGKRWPGLFCPMPGRQQEEVREVKGSQASNCDRLAFLMAAEQLRQNESTDNAEKGEW